LGAFLLVLGVVHTTEVEAGGSWFGTSLSYIVRVCLKKTKAVLAMTEVVQRLHSQHEALSSNSSTTNKTKQIHICHYYIYPMGVSHSHTVFPNSASFLFVELLSIVNYYFYILAAFC
jgi:hypothetical protein